MNLSANIFVLVILMAIIRSGWPNIVEFRLDQIHNNVLIPLNIGYTYRKLVRVILSSLTYFILLNLVFFFHGGLARHWENLIMLFCFH